MFSILEKVSVEELGNVLIVQASVYEMPFPDKLFDKAFCFGVLQHTPDPKGAFLSIPPHVKEGGKVVADVYLKSYIFKFLDYVFSSSLSFFAVRTTYY